MNVVVAGLSPREEAAFGVFLGRNMKGWSWRGVPGGRGAELPAADLLVADLVSLGLAQWSEAAEEQLLRSLSGSPAVLLLPAHDESWSRHSSEATRRPSLVWLRKPYGTQEMLSALEQASKAHRSPAQPPVAVPAPERAPVALAARTPSVQADAPARQPPSLAAAVATAEEDVPSLKPADLMRRLAALPDPDSHVFLRQLSAALARGEPFEARFTFQHSMIVDPAQDWVASNTPLAVIERVCQSDALASVVTLRELSSAQALERAQRLGMPMRELETFLWELAAVSLDQNPTPSASEDRPTGQVKKG